MKLELLQPTFAVCKVPNISEIDFTDEFYFIGKTDEELSLVCNSNSVPKTASEIDNDWKAFRIQGVWDFSLIGILAKITNILAENKISVFAISTFNTDYILIKAENFIRAIDVLKSNGYGIL
jgi:Uncharacterized conserved protein